MWGEIMNGNYVNVEYISTFINSCEQANAACVESLDEIKKYVEKIESNSIIKGNFGTAIYESMLLVLDALIKKHKSFTDVYSQANNVSETYLNE